MAYRSFLHSIFNHIIKGNVDDVEAINIKQNIILYVDDMAYISQ